MRDPRYRIRRRDEESPSTGLLFLAAGAVAGVVAGVLIAQRFGGLSAIGGKVRARFGKAVDDAQRIASREESDAEQEDEIEDEEEGEALDASSELEERVLEAFRNDPILAERAVDIGAIGEGIIELTGWVYTDDESEHARTVAGGVPGVDTVVNRLDVREDEEEYEANARRVAEGDPALTEAQWEGMRVGTGRRRQGTSQEPDRHADPKAELEERWMRTGEAIREAADDTGETGARRRGGRRTTRGDRTGGAPIAPTGVPKADHVAAPEQAPDAQRAD